MAAVSNSFPFFLWSSLCLKISRTLQQQQNNNNNIVNDPDPNEETNLRSQNMIIKKTTTEYPESKRVVTKMYTNDDD